MGGTLFIAHYVASLRRRLLKGGGNAPIAARSSSVQKDGQGPCRRFPVETSSAACAPDVVLTAEPEPVFPLMLWRQSQDVKVLSRFAQNQQKPPEDTN